MNLLGKYSVLFFVSVLLQVVGSALVCAADADGDGFVDATQISSGYYHNCSLGIEGVKCWGSNVQSQTTVPVLENPLAVSVGLYHSCALDINGVKCWGYNASGQSTVPALNNPIAITAGLNHSCALDAAGVKCWGSNAKGQRSVPMLTQPILISAGWEHTCALDATGVKCWGDNSKNQSTVPALKNPKWVSAGKTHSCAIDDDGVRCWGEKPKDKTHAELKNPIVVSAGHLHTCALHEAAINTGDDQAVVTCWGDSEGNTNSTLSTVPVLLNPSAISTGYNHVCALDDNGVKCWGFADPGHTYAQTVPKADNCPNVANVNQLDTDGDGQGDACDADDDNDLFTDLEEQACDTNPLSKLLFCADKDHDTWLDTEDNCPDDKNPNQLDVDGDGIGNVCDLDNDNDEFTDAQEILCGSDPLLASSVCLPKDTDGDTVIDTDDNCPAVSNFDQSDIDNDDLGDVCDLTPNDPIDDYDADTVPDLIDNCLVLSNEDQLDTDNDNQGNACDLNDDNDAFLDAQEIACGSDPLVASSVCPVDDTDVDPPPNNADYDSDGVLDSKPDNCPLIANPDQQDSDFDGEGDVCDLTPKDLIDDYDADTVPDLIDNCLVMSNEDQLDTDGDIKGNACDTNDDNDAFADLQEIACGSDPLLASSVCVIDANPIPTPAPNSPANVNSTAVATLKSEIVIDEAVLNNLQNQLPVQSAGKEIFLQQYMDLLAGADVALAQANQASADYQLRLSQGATKKELKTILKAQKKYLKLSKKLVKKANALAKKKKLPATAILLMQQIKSQQAQLVAKKTQLVALGS